ncbi:hypothetical protein BSKO_02249 [Bryopsis sp. KO-2023]|nr:hypothetical protein BSKO_02249 [Bryopsis sp. KO-2023]
MSCPFKTMFGGSGGVASQATSTSEKQDVSRCPFASVFSDNTGSSEARLKNDAVESSSVPSSRANPTKDATSSSEHRCPLGFGTSSGPKFTILHCRICRSLLYDCVQLDPCEHKFCSFCVERFEACPLCGADIQNLSKDEKMQDVVNKYIEVHSKNHTIWELDSDLPTEKVDDPLGLERCASTFYLQLGLRSYMGGNLEAAKGRLGLCCNDLEEQVNGHEGVDDQVRCQLGAVCGSLGDCCRRLGDVGTSMEHYQRSALHLRAVHGNPEANSELCVTLNKLGDLRFYEDDVTAARDSYAEALDVRKRSVDETDDPSAEQLLELAVSLTKVADAEQVLGMKAESERAFREAKGVLKRLKQKESHLNGGQSGLFSSLVSFLDGKDD